MQIIAKYTIDLIPGGLRRMVTKEEVHRAIDNTIAEHTNGDFAQRGYLHTMETMMALSDERMKNGEWRILRAQPDSPFVIGDAPVVTRERTDQNPLIFGQGFARPNVEAFVPIFPTACLHVLPAVERTRLVRTPSTDEVNRAQAAFATQHCFTNLRSMDIDATLQPYFRNSPPRNRRFRLDHIDRTQQLFDILMNQPPHKGAIDDGDAS